MLRTAPQPSGPVPVEQMRAGFAALMAAFPVPADVQRTPTEAAGRPALLVEPEGAPRPGTILYFHGGSFSLGSPETALVLTASLVRRTGVRAISLDYRLAPEHPFPAAIDDCVAAFASLLDSGIDPASIVFAGDSAGGGLTVTACLAARDAGLPMPAAIAAFSPGLDHTRSGATMSTKEGVDPFFTRDAMGHTGEMYLGGQDPDQPLLAPAVHADLAGFPPILLQVGTNELLLDDSVRLAERAREAGVDVILDVTAGVPHVFQAFVGTLDEADQALDRAALFLTQHLHAD
jgi:acetyl esterase/lipase